MADYEDEFEEDTDYDDDPVDDEEDHQYSCLWCDVVLCDSCGYCHDCQWNTIMRMPAEWFRWCIPGHPGNLKDRPELELPEGL